MLRWLLWLGVGVLLFLPPMLLGWVDGRRTNNAELLLALALSAWFALTALAVAIRIIRWLVWGWKRARAAD